MAGPSSLAAGVYLWINGPSASVYGVQVSSWLIALGLLAIVVGLVLYVVGQPKPQVVLNGSDPFHVQWTHFGPVLDMMGQPEEWDLDVLFMRVVNRSRRPSSRSAKARVSAHFEVQGAGAEHLPSLDARWTESELPVAGKLPQLTMDLEVDNQRQIAIAVKEIDRPEPYLFNNDSYRFLDQRLQNPAWHFGPGVYTAHVRVSGEGVKKLFWCRFENLGTGRSLKVLGLGEGNGPDH